MGNSLPMRMGSLWICWWRSSDESSMGKNPWMLLCPYKISMGKQVAHPTL